MKKLLAVVCACLMLGGCGQDYSYDTYEYTAAGAEQIDILAADGDTLWFLASYPGFEGGIEYDNCALVEYDFVSGEETLINSVPEGGRLLADGRFWFYDSEEGLMSCSLEDGSERPELEKGNEDRIDVLAGAGEKLLFRRVYEREGVDSVVGYLYDYVLWDRETGGEILLDEQTPGAYDVIGWDDEIIVWSGWMGKNAATLWKDSETETLTIEEAAELETYLSGAVMRLDNERAFYRDPETGYGYPIDLSRTEGQRSDFFFAGEDYYYAVEKDGKLEFVKDELKNRMIAE